MNFMEENNRIYLLNDEGGLAAEVTFPQDDQNSVVIDHTFVDDSLRGQGVAGRMMEKVAEKLRREGKRARPLCSFAVKWFQKHTEFSDILEK